MIGHVKIDRLAHDVAMKARAQCVREAAKARVAAQDAKPFYLDSAEDVAARLTALAVDKEAAAIEWERKAHLAMNPVNKTDVQKLFDRIDNEQTCADIVNEYDIYLSGDLDYIRNMRGLVGVYNAAADFLNKRAEAVVDDSDFLGA